MTSETSAPQSTRARGILSGLVAAGAAVGIGELIAGLLNVAGPIVAVANRVIQLAPPGAKAFAVQLLGSNDKPALILGTVVALVVFAAVIGAAATRRWWVGPAGIALFGVIGALAGITDFGASVTAALPSLVGAVVGIPVLALLLGQISRLTPGPSATSGGRGALTSRRSFLAAGGVAALAAAGFGWLGRFLQGRIKVSTGRDMLTLPQASEVLNQPIPPGASVDVEGMTPFITPTGEFYRVDTALEVPRVAVADWRLRVSGMVGRPMALSWQDIAAKPLTDVPITMTCVSNQVGQELVDNARWRGVRLSTLLDEAGVDSSATQIVGRSVDGYTCGFPVKAAYDRPALLAIGFNDEPLPLPRGYPARLIVPGLYGYVSATKWLQEIQLTTFEDFDQYWVPRGWDAKAPIKLMSRIERPGGFGDVQPGEVMVAGSAWDQDVGIQKVEVRIDDGDWQEAELAEEVNIYTWRQWKFPWQATSGRHDITVRAINKNGEVQTDEKAPPKPNGASGWHSVAVFVA
jgi:DMSO/TMAO reductase YedYZ molybdopterin-dependent catalytic subunit